MLVNGLDSLNFGFDNVIDGLGSRDLLSLPFVMRYDDNKYLFSETGLGSRDRGKDEVMDVIDGRRVFNGLGSLDFSRAFVSVDLISRSNFSNVDAKLLESVRFKDLSLGDLLLFA